MSELSTIVQAHEIVLGITLDWRRDAGTHYREYCCLTCEVEFQHRFNTESWTQALLRAGLAVEDHPKPVMVS